MGACPLTLQFPILPPVLSSSEGAFSSGVHELNCHTSCYGKNKKTKKPPFQAQETQIPFQPKAALSHIPSIAASLCNEGRAVPTACLPACTEQIGDQVHTCTHAHSCACTHMKNPLLKSNDSHRQCDLNPQKPVLTSNVIWYHHPGHNVSRHSFSLFISLFLGPWFLRL